MLDLEKVRALLADIREEHKLLDDEFRGLRGKLLRIEFQQAPLKDAMGSLERILIRCSADKDTP